MWPKLVHKHLQEVEKSVFNWEEPYIDFMILVTESILQWFWKILRKYPGVYLQLLLKLQAERQQFAKNCTPS